MGKAKILLTAITTAAKYFTGTSDENIISQVKKAVESLNSIASTLGSTKYTDIYKTAITNLELTEDIFTRIANICDSENLKRIVANQNYLDLIEPLKYDELMFKLSLIGKSAKIINKDITDSMAVIEDLWNTLAKISDPKTLRSIIRGQKYLSNIDVKAYRKFFTSTEMMLLFISRDADKMRDKANSVKAMADMYNDITDLYKKTAALSLFIVAAQPIVILSAKSIKSYIKHLRGIAVGLGKAAKVLEGHEETFKVFNDFLWNISKMYVVMAASMILIDRSSKNNSMLTNLFAAYTMTLFIKKILKVFARDDFKDMSATAGKNALLASFAIASIALLFKFIHDDIELNWKTVVSLLTMYGLTIILGSIFGKMGDKKMSSVAESAGKNALLATVTFGLVSATFIVISKFIEEKGPNIWKSLLTLYGLTIIMRLVLGAIASKRMRRLTSETGKALLLISSSFVLFALTIYTLGEVANDPEIHRSIGAMGLLVLEVIAVLHEITSRRVRKTTTDAGLILLSIAGSFVLFATTIYILGETTNDPEFIEGFKRFTLIVGDALATILALTGKRMRRVSWEAGIIMISISASFILFAVSLMLLNKIVLSENISDTIKIFKKILWSAIGIYTAMGLAAIPALFGAATAIAISATLPIVMASLSASSKIAETIDWDAFFTNMKLFKKSIKQIRKAYAGLGRDRKSRLGAETAINIFNATSKAFESFKEISGYNEFDKLTNNITAFANILDLLGDGFKKLSKIKYEEDKLNNITKNFKSISKSVSLFSEETSNAVWNTTESIKDLLNNVNNIDISKLTKTTSLMETLKGFSKDIKYNFDGLADIIDKKLVTAIEELKDILDETNDTMSKIKESQETVAENTKTISATSTQNNSQNMNSKKLELMMNNVSKSLDRINDILESTGAKVVVKDIDDSVSKKMKR